MARIVALALVGYALVVLLVQRAVAFPGQFRPPLVDAPPPGVRSVPLAASFGTVEAWYFPAGGRIGVPSDAAAQGAERIPGLIFFHGNGELIDDLTADLRLLADAGITVLAVEFPGYGRSEGRPKRTTVRESAALAFDWLAARPEIDPARIVAFGRSMGGGAAADLATDRPAAALILQSTYSSTMAMARLALAPGFLVRDRFDPRRVVAEWQGPVLLMHGRADEVIPWRQAEAIAAARPGLSVTDIPHGHNDWGPAWPEIVRLVADFLAVEGIHR